VKNNGLQALGAHIAAQQDHALTQLDANETTRLHLTEHVVQRAARRQQQQPSVWFAPRVWAPLAIAALSIFGLFGVRNALWPALQFQIGNDGQSGVLREWAQASATEALPLRFSDGTRVDLEPQARARVMAVSRAGAELVLESGRAHVDVVPSTRLPGEHAWRIDSGPFSVEVKGTEFDVSWDPRADEFALDLFEGVVTVQGCGRENAVRVIAGQGVRASCAKQHWALAPLTELAGLTTAVQKPNLDVQAQPLGDSVAANLERSELPPVTGPLTDEVAPAKRRLSSSAQVRTDTATATGEPPASPVSTWQTLAQDGKHVEAYTNVKATGFASECERANAEELLLLGNVARLGGNAIHAADAYNALRRRFAGTSSAARAAFSLGRLQVKADPSSAGRWFETALREEPRGPFSQAASDWLFELAVKGGSAESQRKRAQDYLDRHQSGAHAEDARRLLEQHSTQP
jgi:FecR protein